MNKELEKEAEKYKLSTANKMTVEKFGFIAGATSKWVEKQKLKSLIQENESILNMLKLHSGDERLMLPCVWRIQELQQQLSEL